MALKQIRVGSIPDGFQYDDGDYSKSISVDDPMECTAAPVAGTDVLRLNDVGVLVGDVIGPAAAVDSNIAEFNGVTGKVIKDGGLTHAGVSAAVGASHTQNTDTNLGVLGTKNPPIDADKVVYRNSVAADVLVTSTWTQVKAFLKTYFDTLYIDYVFNDVTVPVAATTLTVGTELTENKIEIVRISAAGAETLTKFLDGTEGQIKILVFDGGNVSLTDGTRDSGKFYLNQLPALTDFNGADGDVLALVNLEGDGGGVSQGWWEELYRTVKVK